MGKFHFLMLETGDDVKLIESDRESTLVADFTRLVFFDSSDVDGLKRILASKGMNHPLWIGMINKRIQRAEEQK